MSITFPIGSEFHSHSWEAWIAIYLFLGGISAGAFIVAAVSHLMGQERDEPAPAPDVAVNSSLARVAALLAPWPIVIGLGALIIDLGRPLSFWMILINYNLNSVMSIGVLILLVFSPVSLAYAYLWWKRSDSPVRTFLAWAGIILSLSLGVYTGVLISAITTNPVWGSPLLPMLFLVSAISTGIAYALIGSRFFALRPGGVAKSMWARVDAALIGLELFIIALLLIGWVFAPTGGRALDAMVTGGYAPLFWIGIVGIGLVVPLAVNFWEWAKGHEALSPAVTAVTYAMVLTGGFLLRYVILNAGQSAGVTL